MGQYFMVVNYDKREYFELPMSKMMETAWRHNTSANFLINLLKGRWAGDRVAYQGDYSWLMPAELLEEMKEKDPDKSPYHFIDNNFKEVFYSCFTLRENKSKTTRLPWDIDDKSWEKIKRRVEKAYRGYCVLFEDSKIYLDFEAYYKKEEERRKDIPECDSGWIENPLNILIATPDGGGGGDYRGFNSEQVVGMFYGERIRVVKRGDSCLEDCSPLHEHLIIDENYNPPPSFEGEIEDEIEVVA